MRRIHVPTAAAGRIALDPAAAHHLRDVLRLSAGAEVEVFDDAGAVARGVISRCTSREVVIDVAKVEARASAGFQWIVASAVPKGPRADWMIEKLGELGASAFVPLATARSVVHPSTGKLQRWMRLASESASQSRRSGVMRIEPLTAAADFVRALSSPAWVLSTAPHATPAFDAIQRLKRNLPPRLALLIGPEGDWTDDERSAFAAAGLTEISLGTTILRVETAAVAAAAIVAAMLVPAAAPDTKERNA